MKECEKLARRTDEWNHIYPFMEWLQEQGITLAKWDDRVSYGIVLLNKSTEQLLYEFFDVDPVKLERERREILRSLQK